MVAGLRAAPTEIAVFLPVDCPLMTAEALNSLAANCADADAAATETGPLPGAYARRALPILDNASRKAGSTCARRSSDFDARTIQIDTALLVSVNTERDLDRLRALAR